MDISKIATSIVEKLKSDPSLLARFNSDPVKTLESLSGIDLPDAQVQAAVVAVKAQLGGGKAADALGALGKMLK